ncbi:hypothetical protein [Dyella flagellata]|uniref:Lipoprotein n=1 Tax=Dyella flagellata TaxID=1867833 RepID=A0ABQ5XB30_9GAMM|nr:hypothetical protein [Dyella flagellata]GLQ88283.1 hypothetical protein GCM10007898_18520 [Dyella flagellata]
MKCRPWCLLLSIALSACATTSKVGSTYAGSYFYNFEYAYLTPQGMDEHWCVDGDMLLAELAGGSGSSDVVVQGVVGPIGHYGNLGVCQRVIKVTRVLEVKSRRKGS